jgi:hypothetical protein
MPVYNCEHCQFTTQLKANYTAHVSSQKHLRFVQIHELRQPVIPDPPQIQPVDNPTPQPEKVTNLTCKHCDKKFAFKQSMYRHIKNSCKNKDQELDEAQDPKEMIRLLKIEMEKMNADMEKQMNEMLDDQQRQIDHLMKLTFQTEHVNVAQLKKDILEQINHVFDR